MPDSPPIPTEIIESVQPSALSPNQVSREFRDLFQRKGAKFHVAGEAKANPLMLLEKGFSPKFKIQLFQTTYYLTKVQQIPELRFFVGYVVQVSKKGKPQIYPRIFYKDLSLAWRSASHFSRSDEGIWIGKGDVQIELRDGDEYITSSEATTDLPLECQSAFESLVSPGVKTRRNESILDWVLKRSPVDRVEPYRDFVAPRKRASADRRNLINRGRHIAKFTRKNDPTSLKVNVGYEPDFDQGVIETSQSMSKLYGGRLERYRILSSNKKIQYYFLAGKRHVWLFPPQSLTTQLSSFGVRTIDVAVDDDLNIPGWEYHHEEETSNGSELYSQIPPGFAGEVCPVDDVKADASPWLDKIPLIIEFRRRVLNG